MLGSVSDTVTVVVHSPSLLLCTVMDVVLAVVLAVIQLFLAWFSVDYELKRNRKRFAIIIGGAGFVGVILLGITAYRAVRAQDQLSDKVREIGELQQKVESKVTIIEKNTEQPATVHVSLPPQPKSSPYALLALSNLESSYSLPTKNGPTNAMLLDGYKVSQNIYFENVGTTTADGVSGWGKVYILPSSTPEDAVVSQFKNDLAQVKKAQGSSLQPGGHEQSWFTAKSDEDMTPQIRTQLEAGSTRLWLVASTFWRDPTGQHYRHLCMWLQQPKAQTPVAVWHSCDDFSDHH